MAQSDHPGWWTRRIAHPIRVQLTQGITVEKIALTISLGLTLGIFPILGATSLLSGLAAWAWRLNQPIIQGITVLSFPLQVILLIPFYRAGEWLFGASPVPLSIPLIIQRFFEDTGLFFRDYGMTGLRGIAVWVLLAPLAGTVLFFALKPSLKTMADGVRKLRV